jgi:cytidylate kinase
MSARTGAGQPAPGAGAQPPAVLPGGGRRGRRRLIAIDGPAGSGKSTLGAALAARLGYTYFDSGVVYRAITWLALERGIDAGDAATLARLAREAELTVAPAAIADGRQYTVLVDGADATWAIRSPAVDHQVSAVSAHPAVRQALTERLRQFAATGGMVMVGRDIGTVVLPHADLKIYLTAGAAERARRRHGQLAARGQAADFATILGELQRRDALDGTRAAAPMRPAPCAMLLDSDHLTIGEEVEQVLRRLARDAARCARPGATRPGPAATPLEGQAGAPATSRRPAGREADAR